MLVARNLFYAVVEDDEKKVQEILSTNWEEIHINWRNPNFQNRTILFAACHKGNLQVIEQLLSHPKIDVNIPNDANYTPLNIACCNSRVEVVERLLNDLRVDVNFPTVDSYSPIANAASLGLIDVVKVMLVSGRKPLDVIQATYEARNRPDLVAFLKSYQSDPLTVLKNVRKELKVQDPNPVRVFLLIVLLCDGYFTIKENASYKRKLRSYRPKDEELDLVHRFFQITRKIPLDLQMVTCNRLYNNPGFVISSKRVNQVLKYMLVDGSLS